MNDFPNSPSDPQYRSQNNDSSQTYTNGNSDNPPPIVLNQQQHMYPFQNYSQPPQGYPHTQSPNVSSQQQYSQQQGYLQGQPPQSYPQPQYSQPPTYPPFQQPYPYPQQQYSQYPPQPQNYSPVQPPQAYPPQQAPQMNTFVNVNVQQSGPGFLVRALYFLFIGWWLGWFWLNIGFAFCAFIVTLPLGLIMLNRVPQILTLRPGGQRTNVQIATTMANGMMVNNVNINIGQTQQYNILIRAIYFLFIGCWLGWIWANVGYFFCLTLLGLPLGLIMLNRLPMVLTLRKN
jgi:uncharacterized membrane protein YccF (DUF307 family)